MIAVIRIAGMVEIEGGVQETLNRLRLRRKYSLVLLEDNQANLKILKHLRNHVAYGKIDSKTIEKLIEIRAEPLKKSEKVDVKKVIAEIGKKDYDSLGIKPFFRLHPPRGGIESKKHFGVGKGVLGDNGEKINLLIGRML